MPLAVGVVVVGQVIEGGSIGSLIQATEALIVGGGTLGAVLISHSPSQVVRAARAAVDTFFTDDHDAGALAATLVALAIRGHRQGLASLESELGGIDDAFMTTGLALAIDGASPESITQVLTVEKLAREADEDAPARVWEAAAGYAPTLGILGAVLGLIQAMNHIGTPRALGSGLAVAFVATLYGVGAANLILLPIAGRLRERATAAARRRDLICEGLLAISQRANPRLVVQRLRPLASTTPRVEEVMARLNALVPVRLSA